MMSDANVPIHKDQGGAKETFDSGAELEFQSGSTLDVQTGTTLNLGGTDEAELDVLDGVTPGTVTASKALVVDANKDLGDLRNLDAINIDAGSSGVAGSVDVFPASATSGKTSFTATDNSGNTTTTINTAAQAGARNYTVPDAGASASFVMTEGAQTINGAKAFGGVITPSAGIAAGGGFAVSPRLCHTGGVPAQASTDGTDLTIVATELYVAEVFVPANVTVTGAAAMWGSATEGNAKVMLFDSSGNRVAISASTDVSGYSTDSYGSNIPFTGTYAAKGPATYYLGVMCDDTNNRLNTHILGAFGAGKITGLAYATEASYATITPPTTFTTGLGPIASLY